MNIIKARNPRSSPSTLHQIALEYNGNDRDLGEALILNQALQAETLDLLLEKCSQEIQLLALTHPNLTSSQQLKIVGSIKLTRLRTKAKMVLLHRTDLTKETLAVLCLDPNGQVRTAALKKLGDLDDTNSNSCQRQ